MENKKITSECGKYSWDWDEFVFVDDTFFEYGHNFYPVVKILIDRGYSPAEAVAFFNHTAESHGYYGRYNEKDWEDEKEYNESDKELMKFWKKWDEDIKKWHHRVESYF